MLARPTKNVAHSGKARDMAIGFLLWLVASQVAMADTQKSVEQLYLELEPLSLQTRRHSQDLALADAPVDLSVFTRLRRSNSNGREVFSNATLIAGGQCHWIASAAGHSVLDHRFSRPTSRGDIAVRLPDGSWVNPLEIVTSPSLSWNSEEIDDWALLVLPAPRCQFDSNQRFASNLPALPTAPVTRQTLDRCVARVQMLCYHFDQGEDQGKRMLENNCRMRHRRDESASGTTGYMSCKVDYGVSGCSPVCRLDSQWLNLGVFSKGLKRHGSSTHPQPVGAFRVIDGELAEALAGLRQKYGL